MTIHLLYLFIILCLLPTPLADAAERDVEIIPGTTIDRLTKAFTGNISTPTMFRELRIKVPLPDGSAYNGRLLVVCDTASGRSWWLLRRDPGEGQFSLVSVDWFDSHAAVYVAEDTIVTFWTFSPGQLLIVERRGLVAASVEEAQWLAINEIRRRRAAEYKKGQEFRLLDGVGVKLPGSLIPFEFWYPPFQANMPAGGTKVISATRDGKNWKLILRDQWDQELILDESYAVVSSRRLDSPAPGQK